MSNSKFSPEIRIVLDQFLLGIPGVTAGKMFGYPAYYIRDKLFACIYEKGAGSRSPRIRPKTLQACRGSPSFTAWTG